MYLNVFMIVGQLFDVLGSTILPLAATKCLKVAITFYTNTSFDLHEYF